MLVAEQATAEYYETVAKGRDPKIAANWVTGDLFAALNRSAATIADIACDRPHRLGELLDLIADNTITGRIAKDVFEAMVETGKIPPRSSRKRACGRSPIPARSKRRSTQVLAANADKVAEYRSGKDKLFGFFVGQVMKAMGGKANPALVNDTLRRALTETN